ncbi:hypothetical protein [Chryseobacterium oncorhynchi]|uniref:Uncharacterized protein n=1 Tax=Chryseobacterium oncorhynchi TaxID=741074 RepID=A0A316WES7_9FLAO|nr:hypothetical protein [Chryseobacterium oncorhynchi]PWN59954.1 hypothetical protein C1638_020520 [Chryseobacterium oncorhynchi]
MKKLLIKIVIAGTLLTLAYEMGYRQHKNEANGRAKEMIDNEEIPNYSMEVGTLDFIINNKSGELEKSLKN